MCWGVPARVLNINGHTALVDFGGVRKEVLVSVRGLSTDELVVVHAGVVIGKLDRKDLLANVALYRDMLVQELLDAGFREEAAKEKAADETDKLLASLGIHESLGQIEGEVQPVEVSKEESVPSNAFKRTYRISLSDTDYLQVMHYTNYFKYCERAQQELLESLGFGYSTLIHKFGLFIPTVETSGKFKAPVRLDNVIEVAVWVEEIGSKHIKFRNLIKNLTSNKIVGGCSTVSVCTDTTLMESMPLPPELVEKLKRYKA
jgi:acyl-CoA thioester hydrolase